MIEHVDPFIGTDATALPEPTGLAATWWAPKPLVGNTHPGATYPLGMVSACAYSGAYPTGYGRYDLGTEGLPVPLHEGAQASGFTHFQQSGTGAIRKYYNYFRVTPMLEPLDSLGRQFGLSDEEATPGYYAATLDSGVRAEITVGPKSAIHRYTFPEYHDARLVIDFSQGGLSIPFGATIPLRGALELVEPGVARGEVVMEGTPLAVHIECDTPHWRQLLWYDRRLMHGGTRLDLDHIRPTTLRPFGMMWQGPALAGQTIELRIGFSLRGVEQAEKNLEKDTADARGGAAFTARLAATERDWKSQLKGIEIETDSDERRTVFYSALYHSLIKPCLAMNESPFWAAKGPYAYDFCTMWDIYRTQLPLLTALQPKRAVDFANALLSICEQEGNLPIGYRMARGSDRFGRQGSALAHTFFADLCQLKMPVDWDWALVNMHTDLRRSYGEDFLQHEEVHPISHTLDLAFGYWCTAKVAQHVGDDELVAEFADFGRKWRAAFGEDGLLKDSNFYEGTKHNYSFRLLHDMAARIEMAGGDDAFVAMLDDFFGYGAEPVTQPGLKPGADEMAAGYALGRFEGLNNEPDMEAPWAYYYAGRPDRTAEIVHNAVHQKFGTGRGGLPGNDDSGGLSSWYVWACLGLFPVAGQNIFLVGAPAFRSATMRVAFGELAITTDGFVAPTPGGPVQYVQSATFNGAPVTAGWISGTALHRGGELRVTLGATPSDWATTERPPSW